MLLSAPMTMTMKSLPTGSSLSCSRASSAGLLAKSPPNSLAAPKEMLDGKVTPGPPSGSAMWRSLVWTRLTSRARLLEADQGRIGRGLVAAGEVDRAVGEVAVVEGLTGAGRVELAPHPVDLGGAEVGVAHGQDRPEVAERAVLAAVPELHGLALDAGAAAARTDHAVEDGLGRLAGDHRFRDGVGVALVDVAALADAALEGDPGALLHDVGGLVGRGVEIGRAAEGDVATGGVGLSAERGAGRRGLAADVGADVAHVVGAEGPLDLIGEGQGAAGARDAGLRDRVDRGGLVVAALALALHRGGLEVLAEGIVGGRGAGGDAGRRRRRAGGGAALKALGPGPLAGSTGPRRGAGPFGGRGTVVAAVVCAHTNLYDGSPAKIPCDLARADHKR
jgi:hypothetical protein